MAESYQGQLFINNAQVGEHIEIMLPGFENKGERTTLHYLESGVGEPLILVHSLGQSLYTWRNVFADLSENYRVLAFDLPGHGYSGRPESFAYSMDEMAWLIKQFMDAKGIQSAHFIGFSFGAIYMLRFLTLYPQCVANCIAISPGGLTQQMPRLFHNMKNPLLSVFARNLFSAGDVRRHLQSCVFNAEIVDDRMVQQYYDPLADGLSREALMYALQNFDLDLVADGLTGVNHEVTVLWGREDPWRPLTSSVYFQGVLQAGRYYMLRQTGHLLQEENPDKFLEAVFSYIPPARPSYLAYRYTDYRYRSGYEGYGAENARVQGGVAEPQSGWQEMPEDGEALVRMTEEEVQQAAAAALAAEQATADEGDEDAMPIEADPAAYAAEEQETEPVVIPPDSEGVSVVIQTGTMSDMEDETDGEPDATGKGREARGA